MKTSVISIVIWSLVVLVLVGLFAFLLLRGFPWKNGNNWNFGIMSQTYANADKYTAGDTTISSAIRTLDVNWVSGEVNLVRSDGDSIRVYESTGQASTDQLLHWWLEGDTLHIQFCESKTFFGLKKWAAKILTIEIPSSMSDSLKSVDIESVSADVSVRGFDLDELDIETVSGGTSLCDLIIAKAELSTTSGEIGSERCIFGHIKCDSVSGEVVLTGSAKTADIESVSGNITVQTSEKLQMLKIDTVSGNTELTTPIDEDGFTLKFDTVSGDFSCDIPSTHEKERYICCKGLADYSFDSVSGDLTVRVASSPEHIE